MIPSPKMQHVDNKRLATDLPYRVQFLREFIEFREADEEALKRIAPIVAPLVPQIIDAVYEHLFRFSNTKVIFTEEQQGFTGNQVKNLDDLKLDSEQMVFRKDFLKIWAKKVVTANYKDGRTWEYLDRVGEMHTGAAVFKHRSGRPPLHVDLMYCSILLGWVESFLVSAVMGLPDDVLPLDGKQAAALAVNKILWIQNDLFQRHYVKEPSAVFKQKAVMDKCLNTAAWVTAGAVVGVACVKFLRL